MVDILSHFTAWATDQGVISKLVPKESRGMGTGLYLVPEQYPHDPNESSQGELLFVPRSLLLSRTRILQLQCPPLQKTFEAIGPDNLTERLAIILFLLLQRLILDHKKCSCWAASPSDRSGKGEEQIINGVRYPGTLFEPYIATLPDVCTPVTVHPEVARGYLSGTLLLDSVNAKRGKLESEFELLSGKMGVFEEWPVHPSLDNFIWADATFWSRVLSFGTQWAQDQSNQEPDHELVDIMHMVPFLDFANHAAEPNIRWHVDTDGLRVWAKESLLNDFGEAKQENHGKQDQEVFLSYGNKPNMELLFLYGFILQDNPTQFLTLVMPMDEDDPYYMPKAHTLTRLGIPPRITVYLDNEGGPEDLVELGKGLWVTQESQYLLWVYSLQEDDGLGALIEEPEAKVCVAREMPDINDDQEQMEEADLIDENTVGRLLLTIQGTKIESKELLQMTVPKLEIYPVLVLRSLVLVNQRIEHYISRIMETGDKVQRADDIQIVQTINYDAVDEDVSRGPLLPIKSVPSRLRLKNNNVGECLVPTLLEPDHEHPITTHQLEVEVQISSLVSAMKNYRTEEMEMLVRIGNILGEAQIQCLEESDFIKEYLSRMQNEVALDN